MADRIDGGAVARQIFLGTMMRSFGGGREGLVSGSKQLAEAMRDMTVPKGTVIYRAGEAPERIYFVVRGRVRLEREGMPNWELEDRSVLGIIDANLERPHVRNAVALTDVHLLWIPTDDYFEMLEDNFEQVRGVSYGLCSGLRGLMLELAPSGGFGEPPERKQASVERPLTPVERIFLLQAEPAFARASIQALATLADLAEELRLNVGDRLPLPGVRASAIHLVARGQVELGRGEPAFRARFGAGALVGGLGGLGWNDPAFVMEALAPSTLLRVRDEDLFDVMEEHFELARSILAFGAAERERLANLLATKREPGRTAKPESGAATGVR